MPNASCTSRSAPAEPSDIETRDDVRAVVHAFYHNIADDPVLGPFFDAVDLEAHVPTLVDFWSSVLFHAGTYRGRPFEAHAALDGLAARHFRRWLNRFEGTIDARYAGPTAQTMKQRARQIATVFQTKLDCIDDADIERRFSSEA
jgi:hemoglobin